MTSRPSRLMTPRPSRPHLGPGHSTPDHNAAPLPRYANCGRAKEGHESRRHSGYVTALGRDCRAAAAGAYAPTPPDLASTSLSAPSLARASTSGSAPSQAPHERAPNATSQRRWGGSTPNHPAALRSGMRMGFKPPEQHHTTHSPNKRERTQVARETEIRVSAKLLHLFGGNSALAKINLGDRKNVPVLCMQSCWGDCSFLKKRFRDELHRDGALSPNCRLFFHKVHGSAVVISPA
jgi:hypothetical protein